MVIAIVILFALIAIAISAAQAVRRSRILSESPLVKKPAYQFKVESLVTPSGVYFSPTHSWAHLLTTGNAKVGIDAFIQGLTGVLSSVLVPEVGQQLKQGQPMFTIVHGDKKLTITAPISGVVRSINEDALQNMRLIHRDPYNHGWLCEMSPENWENETARLYLGQRTIAWLKTEVSRIRDFFAHSFAPAHAEDGLVILQEGGEIAECALAFAGKGLWGSFQKLILDQANAELTINN